MHELVGLIRSFDVQWEQNSYYDCYNNIVIEANKWNNKTLEIFYIVYALNKKSDIIYRKTYRIGEMLDANKNIFNSHLVVLSCSYINKFNILKMLREFCYKHKCFCPIAFSNDSDILFFPKLRYQDNLLIRNILSDQFENRKYYIAYGGNEKLIVI